MSLITEIARHRLAALRSAQTAQLRARIDQLETELAAARSRIRDLQDELRNTSTTPNQKVRRAQKEK